MNTLFPFTYKIVNNLIEDQLVMHMSGVEPGRDRYVKKLEEIINRIEKIVENLKSVDIPDKTRLLEELEDLVSSAEDAIDRLVSGKSWSEEVKEVVTAATPMVEKTLSLIGDMLSKFLTKYMETMDGKKIGENVAALYKSLKEAGMPEELIRKTISEYITQITTMSSTTVLSSIANLFEEFLGRRKRKEAEEIGKEKELKEQRN